MLANLKNLLSGKVKFQGIRNSAIKLLESPVL